MVSVYVIYSFIMIGFCLYLVLAPLYRKSVNSVQLNGEEKLDKTNLYAVLNEIEMDYNMKKLSLEDYEHIKKQYHRLLSQIIRKEQQMITEKNHKEMTAEIEQELERLRHERKED